MKNILLCLTVATLTVLSASADKPALEKPAEEVAVLSIHETKAVFKGLVYRRCMGRTSRCPERCGDSGEYAQFEITEYTKYEKEGKYGDPKQTTYLIQVSDFDKKPLDKDNNGNDLTVLGKVIKDLKPGDQVELSWQHQYITATSQNGGKSKFPRRVVVKLEKLERG
ncbi:hypothetical protein [Oceaniferula spumae]